MMACAHIAMATPNVMIMEYNRAMHLGWYRDFIEPDFPSIWYKVGRLEARLNDSELRGGSNEIALRVDRHIPDPDGMTLPVDDPRRPDDLMLTNMELIITYKREG